MSHITTELSTDWLNFAKASLATRMQDAEEVTVKVLKAVHGISSQLEDKQAFKSLLAIKSEVARPSDVLPLLQDVIKHLDSQDKLSQLIVPLYTVLQFEDRTRQKMEGLLGVMTIWSEVRNDNSITDKELAAALMEHVVSMEQQTVLAKYFPDHIQIEAVNDELELF